MWLNQSRAPAGVPCCGLAPHFGFGLSPQPTDARCARGEELQGERTLLRGQIDARRGGAGCVGPRLTVRCMQGDCTRLHSCRGCLPRCARPPGARCSLVARWVLR